MSANYGYGYDQYAAAAYAGYTAAAQYQAMATQQQQQHQQPATYYQQQAPPTQPATNTQQYVRERVCVCVHACGMKYIKAIIEGMCLTYVGITIITLGQHWL